MKSDRSVTEQVLRFEMHKSNTKLKPQGFFQFRVKPGFSVDDPE
ncbi:MAG: hypothetical protein AB9861_17865 [Methanosarcina sp.]|jgi:hypothetical protein